MAKRKIETGLGRGLDALFGDPDLPAQGEGSVSLPISQVEPGLNQPRKQLWTRSHWPIWPSLSGSTGSSSP